MSKNTTFTIKIQKSTLQFLQTFCPKTIKTCILSIESIKSKPRSKFIEVTFRSNKCGCIENIIEESNLFENTNQYIYKDLLKVSKGIT